MKTSPFAHIMLTVGLWLVLGRPVEGQPIILSEPTNEFEVAGSAATFSVTVSGTPPFSFQWQFDGTNLPADITTVAGNGAEGYSGDGGAATNAELDFPTGVAVDSSGNLFLVDESNNRIRKVSTNGIITTVAGNGTNGYSGDGGAATNAEINYPYGVRVDAAGDLFIADYGNYRVRKVSTNGIITTVAGNGTHGYSGDGGAATNAGLNAPADVAVDSMGNLFIADFSMRIRKVSTNGIVTTVAGNGTQGYSGDGGAATNAELGNPYGVAVDGLGNLFIAEYSNNRIRKVSTNGIITTFAGNGTASYSGDGGAATNAELQEPIGVAVDGLGNLFIGDNANNRIRKVSTNGIITTVAGNGTQGYSGDGGAATNAGLSHPWGVALDNAGNLFIGDFQNQRVREIEQMPTLTLTNLTLNEAGNYDVVVTGPSGSVTSSPVMLSVVPPAQPVFAYGGNVVLTNGNYKVHVFTQSGTFVILAGHTTIESLVVGGGGGGGTGNGGGGGAGGLVYTTNGASYLYGPGYYSVVVGSGGEGGGTSYQVGGTGGNSSFGPYVNPGTPDILAYGGGGGGEYTGYSHGGLPGGSGGGGFSSQYPGGPALLGIAYGNTNVIEGYPGGAGGGWGSGGGAGGAGTNGPSPPPAYGYTGGTGLPSPLKTGTNAYDITYATGGNGPGTAQAGDSGQANSGNGGGGGYYGADTAAPGGNGGTGIVILKYQFR
jgi:hypothetical protein